MDFRMSNLGHAVQAVALLRSLGYSVSLESRQLEAEDVVIVTVSANGELGASQRSDLCWRWTQRPIG